MKISSDGKQVNVGQFRPIDDFYDGEAEALSIAVRPRHSYSVMVKWRCCPELVQIHGCRSIEVLFDTPPGSPKNCPGAKGVQYSQVKTSILGFGHVLSDQPAASCLEHCRSPSCDVGTAGPMPYRPDYYGLKETPYSLDQEDSDRRGHGLWLSDYTKDIADREEEHEVTMAQVLTLSPKSGLGSRYLKLDHGRRPSLN
ncbi:hypothetical protein DY000_02020762 [Brassica cretica]|uniref:Uncharacterized protein n=1 Tax=Brassica cretica TaxID=69181 RepID=A0ABQ7EG53_BRACR|nr:hypothetical protein DY000_02020762 [Brassica cretica]